MNHKLTRTAILLIAALLCGCAGAGDKLYTGGPHGTKTINFYCYAFLLKEIDGVPYKINPFYQPGIHQILPGPHTITLGGGLSVAQAGSGALVYRIALSGPIKLTFTAKPGYTYRVLTEHEDPQTQLCKSARIIEKPGEIRSAFGFTNGQTVASGVVH